jgi:4-amino-4-deoxy-L-arabinose transferase-like glycosyltransferase
MNEDTQKNIGNSENPDVITAEADQSASLPADNVSDQPVGEQPVAEAYASDQPAQKETVAEEPVADENARESLPETAQNQAPDEPATAPENIQDSPQAQAYPLLKVETQVRHTLFSRLYNCLSLLYPLILTALVLAVAFFQLQNIRDLWAPGETVLAEVLKNVLAGDWQILQFNGSVYYDAPPLYFWFLTGIHQLVSLPVPDVLKCILPQSLAGVMFIGTALSSVFLLWATLFMARYVAGFDRRGAFAAGCVLLSFFLFLGILHYNCMDILFTALVIMAESLMFLALRRPSSMWRMGLGFVFASLAFLVKGLPGLLVPIACAVLFAFWQARPWRLLRKDFLLGFFASLLPVVLWVGSIWAAGHHELVVLLIKKHFLGPIVQGWQFEGVWWYYCLALPLLLLPWILLVLFPNWLGFFSKGTFKAIAGAFRGAYQGLSFVWLSLICAAAGFLFLSSKNPLDLLPLLPPLAIIAGRLVLSLSPLRSMLLQRLLAVLLIIVALVFAVLPVYLSGKALSVLDFIGALGIPVLNVEIGGAYIIAVAFLAAGCLFIGGLNSRRPESTLLLMLLLVTGLAYPVSTFTAPSLDKMLSPKSAAQELRQYVDAGYTAFSFGVEVDPYVYYADGAPLTFLAPDSASLDRVLHEDKKIILLAGLDSLNELQGKAELSEVKKFRLAEKEYVLLVNALKPSAPPAAAAPAETPSAEDPAAEKP